MTATEKSYIRRRKEPRALVPIAVTWTMFLKTLEGRCYDMADKGDKYELQLEIPGIDKDRINVRATKNS